VGTGFIKKGKPPFRFALPAGAYLWKLFRPRSHFIYQNFYPELRDNALLKNKLAILSADGIY